MHNYKYKILETSEQNILSIEDVKKYARISNDNDDKLLLAMINTAILMAENFIKISLVKKTIEIEASNATNIRLPFIPVVEIIKVIADGEEVDLSDIRIDSDILTLSKHLECKLLNVIYIAGHDDPSLVPAPITQGIMLHVASMYDMRGGDASLGDHILAIYRPYRKIVI